MLINWSFLKSRLRVDITPWLCAYEVFSDTLLRLWSVIANLMGHRPLEIAPECIYVQICLWIEYLLGLILLRVLTHSSTACIAEFFCLGYVLAESIASWLVMRINLRQCVLVI